MLRMLRAEKNTSPPDAAEQSDAEYEQRQDEADVVDPDAVGDAVRAKPPFHGKPSRLASLPS